MVSRNETNAVIKDKYILVVGVAKRRVCLCAVYERDRERERDRNLGASPVPANFSADVP